MALKFSGGEYNVRPLLLMLPHEQWFLTPWRKRQQNAIKLASPSLHAFFI